ncbi:MAG: hypothetical protein HY047_09890 [Acidobacteria bacterium]|nr:hypothetical protein [Acidobacteriota bacterium]
MIFDKSLLEAVSLDECVWLAQFYRANVTPMFFVETIADLEKDFKERTPEGVVARLALKTSAMTADANAHHVKMCTANLLGHEIELRGVPAIEGGRSVAEKGKKGIVFGVPDEARMLSRWQQRKFSDADRATAREWRAALEDLDLDRTYATFRRLVEKAGKPKDLEGVKALADALVADPSQAEAMLGLAFMTLGIPREAWGDIFNRWKGAGGPILPRFAPYAAHCFSVEMFFSIAIGSDLISKDRPSNKADLAYLFYLPFCMVFTSSDRLHEKTVPLFLRGNQTFVSGVEMKADLKKLDEHYSALPEETKAKGVMSFAFRPPLEGDFLATKLWDKHLLPIWRDRRVAKPERSSEAERELIQEVRDLGKGATATERIGLDAADFVVMEHVAPVQVGKWRIMPPGIEDDSANLLK